MAFSLQDFGEGALGESGELRGDVYDVSGSLGNDTPVKFRLRLGKVTGGIGA